MAAPQITLYTGDVPNRATDSATEFANNADDMVNYLAIIPDEYNELADFVNGAAETAQASANFAGNWSSLSGAYSAGTGVYHDGITWLLLVNLSSIQSSEPSSSNSNWLALASLTQQATNTEDISEIKNDDISLDGVKTFTSSPVVPTPTTDTQAANKGYIDGLFPAGHVAAFAMDSAPSGYLKANGAAVSRTTYADLYAAIGETFGSGDGSTTFNLPDLRGEFVRGYDDGRGIDSGRTFGSSQDSAFESHNHYIRERSGTINNDVTGGQSWVTAGDTQGNSVVNNTSAIQSSGGSETRPRNIALLYCIKY